MSSTIPPTFNPASAPANISQEVVTEMADLQRRGRTAQQPDAANQHVVYYYTGYELRTPEIGYSARFNAALTMANGWHREQVRKGNGQGNIPYITHLLAVSALVAEHGGDEDQAIAGLLHDAVEDQGGQDVLDRIAHIWGNRVARIVRDCSDTFVKPKPPWRQRKEEYIAHAAVAPLDSQLVSLADKFHNATCTLRDLRQYGPGIWSNFRAGQDGMYWYWGSLAEIYRDSGVCEPLSDAFDDVLHELAKVDQVGAATLNYLGPALRMALGDRLLLAGTTQEGNRTVLRVEVANAQES